MRMKPTVLVSSAICAGLAVSSSFAQTGPAPALKVGAAKVDITPAQDQLPRNYLGILDHIYTRAIVIDNGKTKAALVEVPGTAGPRTGTQLRSAQKRSWEFRRSR